MSDFASGAQTVVCFGDSNTYGFDPVTAARLPRTTRWPGVLQATLGRGYLVIEEGLNGRTIASDDPYSDGRNGRVYLEPCLWSHAPVDIATIMLGTNDLKDTFRLTAPDIARGARLLVDLTRRSLAGPGGTVPRVLLIAPPPLGPIESIGASSGLRGGVDRSRALGGLYGEVAASAGVDFLDAGQFVAVSGLDGIHLDASAHQTLGLAIAEQIKSWRDPAD